MKYEDYKDKEDSVSFVERMRKDSNHIPSLPSHYFRLLFSKNNLISEYKIKIHQNLIMQLSLNNKKSNPDGYSYGYYCDSNKKTVEKECAKLNAILRRFGVHKTTLTFKVSDQTIEEIFKHQCSIYDNNLPKTEYNDFLRTAYCYEKNSYYAFACSECDEVGNISDISTWFPLVLRLTTEQVPFQYAIYFGWFAFAIAFLMGTLAIVL